ncbi:ABC transporter permease [Micromonospora sp. NPDC051141]|uniref:ABC transporter permease n=1 Tax=Micromonospora sp. NPDC051141 TaxID=3364284 RepID=UPI0037BC0E47
MVAPSLVAADTKLRERVRLGNGSSYFVVLMLMPLSELVLAYLIYGANRPDLASYAAVGLTAAVLAYNSVFFLGVVIERERIAGTLTFLLQTPVPRLVWITGYLLAGFAEAALIGAVAITFNITVLDIRLDPGYPALAMTVLLYLLAAWGFGAALSALAVLVKKTASLANLIFPVITLLGGFYYPLTALPAVLRVPAHLLPFGAATEAMSLAALRAPSVAEMLPELVPLATHAVAWCAAGLLSLRWVEHLIRNKGDVDLY